MASAVTAGPPAGSLNRAALILRAISCGARSGTSLREIAKRTGLPRPTIYRVLDALIALGWVERDERAASYSLGAELATLGYSAISRHPIERITACTLATLADALGEIVYLDVRSGLDTVCVGRYESQSSIQVGRGWVGMRVPLGMTPGGMAMLARMPRPEARHIIKANMPRYRRIEGFEEQGFRRTLKRSMEAGHGLYDAVVLDRTMGGLAVAVCDPTGYPVASIGATFIKEWMTAQQQSRSLTLLEEAAERVSEMLFNAARGAA